MVPRPSSKYLSPPPKCSQHFAVIKGLNIRIKASICSVPPIYRSRPAYRTCPWRYRIPCLHPAFDVLQVFGPPSNGLHDEQILYPRQAYAQAADVVNLAVVDRRLLERQPSKCNVDVDPGPHVSLQKAA